MAISDRFLAWSGKAGVEIESVNLREGQHETQPEMKATWFNFPNMIAQVYLLLGKGKPLLFLRWREGHEADGQHRFGSGGQRGPRERVAEAEADEITSYPWVSWC